jgi:prepilin-type processing-associated H-X9-DG protein
VYHGKFSPQVRLLPYLGLLPTYNAINMMVGADPPDIPGRTETNPEVLALLAINATAAGTQIATFLCPSDGGPYTAAGNSYRANVGTGPFWARSAEFRDSADGLLRETGLTRAAYAVDGLSHTAAFSERLRGSGKGQFPEPDRDFWPFPKGLFPFTADELLTVCQVGGRPGASPVFVRGGQSWFWLGRERTLYSHTQQPNGRIPDCLFTALPPPGMSTARSWHPGGVNLLMGDGSTRFVQEKIDLSVWRGLGTRSGSELVD